MTFVGQAWGRIKRRAHDTCAAIGRCFHKQANPSGPAIERQYIRAPRDLAVAHSKAAETLENRCKQLISTDPERAGEHGAMFITVGILRALSIELALKSLIYIEQSKQIHGHDLKHLYRKLTTQTKSEI